jgi:beta-lactamase superfamily II metal-dependent hydrolase
MQIEIIDAGHGDCILVKCDKTLILIDSGPKNFKIRKRVIEQLKKTLNGRPIDIAIVSHNDDDHIGGFKYIIDNGILIKSFIFNSLNYISKVLKAGKINKKISYRQDLELHKLLETKEINVTSLNSSDNPILYSESLKITPLTPNQNTLLSLHDNAIKKNKKISNKKKKELSVSESLTLIKEGKDLFVKDRSLTNKSSLSIILEYKNTCLLFLGDSHEEDVVKALKNYGSVKFDAVKLSHHGSEKNTSSELIAKIGKTEYILCGDKSSHSHPNSKTISRIINFDNEPTIHLSADNLELRKMFLECSEEGFEVNITYPLDNINRVSYE